MRRLFLSLFLTAGAFSCFAGIVREDAQSVAYRQPDGVEVRIAKHPKRVVVAYGSLAKVWDLAGGTAVGVPAGREKSVLPPSMRSLPAVGTATMPNMEKIVALSPDLVLMTSKLGSHRNMSRQLRETGIPAVCAEYSNYGDFRTLLDLFCRISGKSIADIPRAKKVTAEVDAVLARVKGKKGPRCAVVFTSAGGFSLESARTNTGMMVDMLGGKNILKVPGYARVKFSSEQLLLDDPEVVLVVTMGDHKALREKFRKEMMAQPVWRGLSAAKTKRIHFLEPELFLYTPGPDYPAAFRHLAELLYPETKGAFMNQTEKRASVLAVFGTTVPRAAKAYDAIESAMRKHAPSVPVFRTYSSSIVRKKLKNAFPSMEELLKRLDAEGYDRIDIVAGYLASGGEYAKTLRGTDSFRGKMKFTVTTPPLSGSSAIRAFLPVAVASVPKERKPGECVVFMGHGNPEGMVDPFYREMSGALASADADFLLACVEGKPGFEDILPKIKSKRVWLIPFMVVAGDHAVNDLSGPEKDSWKSRLEAAGHECTCVLRGLGEVDAFAEYLVSSPRNELK